MPLDDVEGASARSSWRTHDVPLSIGIAAAGAAGALVRYVVQTEVTTTAGKVPWGTFLVNVSGCLVAGFLLVLLRRLGSSLRKRAVLLAGFIASYTTFSTFAVGVDLLVKRHDVPAAILYGLLSLIGCSAALVVGMVISDHLVTRTVGGTDPRPDRVAP